MRLGSDEKDYVDLPYGTRTSRIEHRFPGEGRLAKLRALKQRYDPHGVFTKELL